MLRHLLRTARAQVRRLTANPFAAERRLLVHGCHHRSGTVWFTRVLSAVARRYGLDFLSAEQRDLHGGIDIFMQEHSRIDPARLPAFRGSHMIRDPRDMIVSGFHYHQWSKEPWLHKPFEQLGGQTYQQALTSRNAHEGLMLEVEHFCGHLFPWPSSLDELVEWDYDQSDVMEIKYEAIMADEEPTFRRLFRHYGFHDEAVETATAIAMSFSFKNMTKRAPGQVQEHKHLRSGKSKQWQDHFTEAHKARFKELAGDALQRLGYEDDDRW